MRASSTRSRAASRAVASVAIAVLAVIALSGCSATSSSGQPNQQAASRPSASAKAPRTSAPVKINPPVQSESSAPVDPPAGGPSDELSGTLWKGGNLYDSDVEFSFFTGGSCKIKTSFMGSGPCTYGLEQNQALISYKGQKYAFVYSGGIMEGDLLGAGVRLVRQ